MKLTTKIKHNLNLNQVLSKLRLVVDKALLINSYSSKDFKEFGLPARIVCDTTRKYVKQKTLKTVKRVKGVINSNAGHDIQYNPETSEVYITCLKWRQIVKFPTNFIKINQIEFDQNYFYLTYEVSVSDPIKVTTTLGVDFNTKGNTCFIAIPETKLAFPIGISLRDVSINYSKRAGFFQSKGKFKIANKLSRKRFRRLDDNYHKVSRKIVDLAVINHSCIVLEDLEGIRKSKCKKEYGKTAWGFYKLKTFIEYKAKLAGVPIKFVDPRNTSKTCSKCGHVKESVSGKKFHCEECGYNSHRDLNAAYNIANKFLNENASKELDLEVSHYDLAQLG